MSDNNMENGVENAHKSFEEATKPAQAAFAAGQKNMQDMMTSAQSMFGMDPSKMTETFRAVTQKSVEQSKEAYARMRSAADEATKALETTMETAHQGSMTFSKKAIEALRSNAEASFSHLEKLVSAKTFAEVIEIQSGYVRKQIEMTTDQAKEIQSLTQSIAQDVMKPGREAFKKATENARSI